MGCAHSVSKYSNELTHFLAEMTEYADEFAGDTDHIGYFELHRGPWTADQLTYAAGEAGIELSDDDQDALREMAGAIVEYISNGDVYSNVYTDLDELTRTWDGIVRDTTQNSCDECGAESEYLGADEPLAHENTCSSAPELWCMGRKMSRSEFIYNGKFLPWTDGGYPFVYITEGGDSMCAVCAWDNDKRWPDDMLYGVDVVEESEGGISCNHCGEQIVEPSEPQEPEEGDITSGDHQHWYQYGKLVLTVDSEGDCAAALREYMRAQGVWPNVWWISDHGNAHLLNVWEG